MYSVGRCRCCNTWIGGSGGIPRDMSGSLATVREEAGVGSSAIAHDLPSKGKLTWEKRQMSYRATNKNVNECSAAVMFGIVVKCWLNTAATLVVSQVRVESGGFCIVFVFSFFSDVSKCVLMNTCLHTHTRVYLHVAELVLQSIKRFKSLQHAFCYSNKSLPDFPWEFYPSHTCLRWRTRARRRLRLLTPTTAILW